MRKNTFNLILKMDGLRIPRRIPSKNKEEIKEATEYKIKEEIKTRISYH
jgi:hypothetical protein